MSGLKRKTGDVNHGGSYYENVVNYYLPQKKNRIADGKLLKVGEVTHRTPPGFSMSAASDYSIPATLHVPRTSVNPGGGRPLVNPREVKFVFDVNYMAAEGIARLSVSGAALVAGDVATSYYTTDGTTFYDSEGGSALSTARFAGGIENSTHPLRADEAIPTAATALATTYLLSKPSIKCASNTRLEMLDSVEIRFNKTTTMMKINNPGRLYALVNDCYASKNIREDVNGMWVILLLEMEIESGDNGYLMPNGNVLGPVSEERLFELKRLGYEYMSFPNENNSWICGMVPKRNVPYFKRLFMVWNSNVNSDKYKDSPVTIIEDFQAKYPPPWIVKVKPFTHNMQLRGKR